ncbi:MAG: outer membrane beta-barrel protein [candidate division Zixibacteria bacterium]|nr:outer membrane beta-barrel protein [candidate division Zixibacteria bacterium]
MSTRYAKFWSSFGFVIILLTGSLTSASEPVDWTGFYAGAFGSYLAGHVTSNDPAHEESTGDYDDDSPMLGIQGGYHKQFDNGWVAGFEIILPLYIQNGTAVDKVWFPDSVTYEANYRYAAFVGVKAGRPHGKALPYAFGAVGIANVDGKTYNVDLDENYSEGFEQSAVATHLVFQLGGGVDYQVNDKMFAGLRVGAFFGGKADHTMPWNEPGPNEFGFNALLVQISGGYRF